MSRKLTIKQREFIKEYIKSKGNGTQAVRVAYPNIKTDLARRQMAYKLVTKGNIMDRVDKELEKEGLSKDFVVIETKKVLEESKHARDKLTALRLLGDIGGYTKPQVLVQQQVPIFSLTQDDTKLIREKLDTVESVKAEDIKA